MVKFYGTFMQKQAFKNHFIEIHVNDPIPIGEEELQTAYALAHGTMVDHFGDKFAFVYSEKDFDGQAERHGLKMLCRICTTDFGSSIEYKVL